VPGLNPSQKRAVEHGDGPLLVLAGAGSGKTRVITHRIARLLDRGTAPEAILAVSFTNKAAGEMRMRMAALVGADLAARLGMSTFHSFGVRLLTEEKSATGFGGRFTIFDQGDALGVVRESLLRLRRSGIRRLDPAAIHARISLWKNRFLGPDDVPETPDSDDEYDGAAREVYPRYEARLRAMSALDFDDLVVLPVRLLAGDARLRGKWQKRIRHLLVDEFQDTNRAQLELCKLLANEKRNVCVVGDDDQSIYGWRGADVSNVIEFESHFPGARVVALEDNYRSRAPILAVANAAIAQSPRRLRPKTLRAARGEGDRVRLVVLSDPPAEAKWVAKETLRLRGEGIRPRDVAVLYRSSVLARGVEEELRALGVPYRVFGGTQIFDKKEIKDAAAYLRSVVNPKDEISLRRILNYPARGIGETTVERVEAFAKSRKATFADAVASIDDVQGIPDAARSGARALQGALSEARSAFRRSRALTDVARTLLQKVGLVAALRDAADGGSSARREENVEFLLGALARYERSESAEKPSILGFLQRITTDSNEEVVEKGDVVTLSTLHAAKGLEFGVVFLIGCVEGVLPHARTVDPRVTDAAPTDVEEERRLFYVGVTRARDRLYVTRPKAKLLRGRLAAQAPSRFLDGLPEAAIDVHEEAGEAVAEGAEVAALAREFLSRMQ